MSEPIPLLNGAYQNRSLIASAQRCVNLYPESNTANLQAPQPVTHYNTPGSAIFAEADVANKVRGTYRTSLGTGFTVIGAKLYFVAANGALIQIGTIADRPTQVIMSDNGLCLFLVDGTGGWVVDLATNSFHEITDPSFYGADFVLLLDTFFVLNRPNTNQFYITLSVSTYAMLSSTGIESGVIVPGALYINGIYTDVPLTGGAGTGATANITVGGSGVFSGTIAGGALYIDGVYNNVPLTGGAGAGAKATITVAGGIVTSVVITTAGTGYVVGNVLSAAAANLGGAGAGFTYTLTALGGAVTLVDIVEPGINYNLGDVLSAANANLGGAGAGFTYTLSAMQTAFDPLDIAAKSGNADPIVGIATAHRELWLIGELTTEVWIGTGAADFYFQQVQGAFINHGSGATYALASTDVFAFWLMQDKDGDRQIVRGGNYEVKKISTSAIVEEIKKYAVVSDAIGYCFQINDHSFYVIVFPSADRTWAYDIDTEQWFEWAWYDENGRQHRHRSNCCMFLYGKNIFGDFENGKLYQLRSDISTDDGDPIRRTRTFPHLIVNGKRQTYTSLIADFTTIKADPTDGPLEVDLRWSDDKGATYGFPLTQQAGGSAEYIKQAKWSRLGFARDRVFELSWASALITGLNAAYITVVKHKT